MTYGWCPFYTQKWQLFLNGLYQLYDHVLVFGIDRPLWTFYSKSAFKNQRLAHNLPANSQCEPSIIAVPPVTPGSPSVLKSTRLFWSQNDGTIWSEDFLLQEWPLSQCLTSQKSLHKLQFDQNSSSSSNHFQFNLLTPEMSPTTPKPKFFNTITVLKSENWKLFAFMVNPNLSPPHLFLPYSQSFLILATFVHLYIHRGTETSAVWLISRVSA